MLEELKNRGLGQNQQGQQGQQAPGQGQNRAKARRRMDQLGRAGDAMGEAEGNLGQGNADSAVDSQGRALDALRKGAQGLAQAMQQQMGQGQGQGRGGRLRPAARASRTPIRSAGRCAAATMATMPRCKVPGEIDVQRARRIIEELRKRFGDFARPQEELDYIERLLKDY